MWKKLKECKTYKDIHLLLGDAWYVRLAGIALLYYSLLPLLMIIGYIIVWFTDDGDFAGVELFYSSAFSMPGMVLVILTLFYTTGQATLGKLHSLKKSPWIIILGLTLVWTIPGALLAEDKDLAINGSFMRNDGLMSYFVYASLFVCGLVVAKEIKDKVVNIIILSANVLSVLMILQLLKVPVIKDIFGDRATATFYNENHFAYFLCIAIMLSFGLFLYAGYEKIKIINLISFAWCYYALVQNGTFGSLLAVSFSLSFGYILYVIKKGKLKVLDLLPIIVGVIIIATNYLDIGVLDKGQSISVGYENLNTTIDGVSAGNTTDYEIGNGRVALWKYSIELIKKKTIFGYGPEGLTDPFMELGLWTDRPHNEFLQIAAFAGIPAFVMYVFALILLFVNKIRNIKALSERELIVGGAVMAYLASAMFGNTMFYTYPFFIVMLAFLDSNKFDNVAPD